MELLPLSEFVKYKNDFITINDKETYKRVTLKLHRKGAVLRDEVKSNEIKTKKQQICRFNQLLVAEIDAKVGGYGIVPKDLDGAIVSSHYFLFDIETTKLLVDYLGLILKTDLFFSQIKAQGSTNYAAIRPKDILKIMIPYCGIEEQKIIVKKLKSIFLNKDEVYNNLKGDSNLIQKLRESILQEAVQGKLVSQYPKDEPATELLRRIKTEKEKLFKEGKIKKEKELPPISGEEIPYKLPKGWEWVRLANLSAPENYSFVDGPFGSNLKREHYIENGIRIIQLQNIGEGFWKEGKNVYTSEKKADELIRCNAYPGELVIAKMAPVARTTIIPNLHNRYVLCSDCVKFKPHKLVSKEYIKYLLNSEIIRNLVVAKATGMTRQRTSLGKLRLLTVPLPPLSEQKRIVEKVDQLMKFCDELEQKIKENQKNSELLMETVLREAFQPKEEVVLVAH